MQVILGANGQIGEELARELKRHYTADIRIVGRNPQKINDTDTICKADLFIKEQAIKAVKDCDIAYFTLGLPINTKLWEDQFFIIVKNVIDACKMNGTKFVYFDNTYMYPQDDRLLTEQTIFDPVGSKGLVRKAMVEAVLNEINLGTLEAVICRAPEFYGPDRTQSITNSLIFDNIKYGKRLKVPISDHKKRSLIWTPDASRATALIGNTPDAFGNTWHLPVDGSHLTYKEFITLASKIYGQHFNYSVVPKFFFQIASWFSPKAKELLELLPRYAYDNLFDDSNFRKRFPQFSITSYEEGITQIKDGEKSKRISKD